MQTVIDKYKVKEISHPTHWHKSLSFILLLAMLFAVLLLDAILPLQALGFSDALLSLPHIGSWLLWPTHLLFPGQALISPGLVANTHTANLFSIGLKWYDTFLLLGAFVLIFLLYLLSFFSLPRSITYRYILGSTLLLGLLYVLIPVVTSHDVFLYIGYARMEVIYHLNPLAAVPKAIHSDPIYPHISWVDQPSLYGPTWIVITSGLQWLALVFGFKAIASITLLLRLFGLSIHLGSTQLIWMLSGRLQRIYGSISPRVRIQAVLAFALNPLLLFEACVNAHSDTLVLFLVLFALWFLVRDHERASFLPPRAYIGAAIMFALSTCVKINIAILLPGLLLYLWVRPHRLRTIITVSAVYIGTILLLYAPFWQHGAIIEALGANPSTSRDVNTLAEFLSDLAKSIAHLLQYPLSVTIGQSGEAFTRTLSIILFVVAYAILFWKTMYTRRNFCTSLHLIRWMALTWLLYCAIGAPWFWPWYLITFFGLFALVASVRTDNEQEQACFKPLQYPAAIYFLAFSMLSLYCFYTFGPLTSSIPLLPGFHWAYLRGLWAWFLPPLVFALYPKTSLILRRKELAGKMST